MKGLVLLVSLIARVVAIQLVNRGPAPSTLTLEVERRRLGRPVHRNLRRQTAPLSETLDNLVSRTKSRSSTI